MKDSGNRWIGKIPESWESMRVRHVIKSDADGIRVGPFGSSLKEAILEDGISDYKVYGQANLIRHNFEYGDNYVTEKDFRRLKNYEIKAGDVLLSMMGTIGKCSVVPNEIKTGIMDSHLIKIRLDDTVNPAFFEYVYEHSGVVYEQLVLGSNGSTMNGLNSTIVKNTYIPVPPLSEQHVIAAYLDRKCGQIDDIIADLQRQIARLESYKKSLISETVTKGLNPDVPMKDSGIEWIGQIPEHWDSKKIRYLGSLQNGISKDAASFGSGYPFLSYGNVYNNDVLPNNPEGLIESTRYERKLFSVECGDVFFTRTSETAEEIGFASTCLEKVEDAVFAGFLIRFRPWTSLLIPEYSRFYFRSEILRKYFVKEMMVVTRASLGQNLLKNLPVLLPPVQEQKQLATYLDRKCAEIDTILDDKRRQVENMKNHRKSVIYEYVTGKKRVKEV